MAIPACQGSECFLPRAEARGLRPRKLVIFGRVTYAMMAGYWPTAVIYPWWKNLRAEATVRVLLRGEKRTGRAEVLPQGGGVAVVKVHLTE
jgi:hypothetical protein